MPELLFELFSEEIPARMQAKAAEDLRRLVGDALIERGITFEGAKAFATPRRIALHVAGLPQRQPDTKEERKGPRVGAPEGALQGFVKSAGLSSIGEAKIVSDGKKGEMYVAIIEKPGRLTIDVLAEVLPAAVRAFPWPKSMRWGVASAPEESPWGGLNARGAQALRWVRPLQSIVATFGPETEDPEIVRFEIDGIAAGNVTQGHRFLAPQAFAVRRLDDYAQKLEAAKVVLDRERRKDIIRAEAQTLAFAQGLDLVEDEGLLDEVAGLVEWPVVLMGGFDAAFLDVPDAVIRATIRANQKCFVLRNPATGRLTNKFLLTSNIVATDGGKTIVDGNERVIRARLSDALYFWKTDQNPLPDAPLYGTPAEGLGLDLAKPLDQRMGKLAHLDVVFHEKLGTQGQRVQRIAALAAELAPIVGADAALARRAAVLAKADLMTEVVGEFPELQGFMGRVYAEKQGEHPSVCAAIEDHYKPLGPSDRVPTDKVAIAVALADKLDTLVGFWAIDEKPTGSKDPYALRRAALGVIRLVVENGLRLPLAHSGIAGALVWLEAQRGGARLLDKTALASELMEFFHDRLKVMLRDQGARHDLVDAVLSDHAAGQGAAAPAADDLLLVTRRVEALGRFLTSEDGANLLAGYRRAANILRAEEKKAKDKNEDAGAFAGGVDGHLLADPREKLLHDMIGLAGAGVHEAVAREDFEKAMSVLATLRPAVDAFFEHVIVNAEEAALRLNRLRLLGELRATCHLVADFSAISGG